ncbi:ribose 5-phosphate isomerase B [Desulfuribacillus stibiiarsenatis]|uniref:Ribose 5-phosphate isomerase B n=1 Tax=Desulfuribacillus stibiiarsenatis TaxID=1390249 RepID=A0A1E5L5N4_9FIRM|nr:ribose 5-phosphate isomerase B [Desulfuribacillus stibiiarsenatis]OEH85431.1 ribose 5-phosphate isomerase B [Desulfuribacillus stibiiarsenatis]
MKVAIAADHGGYVLKEEIKELIHEMGYEVFDFGTSNSESVDYPDYALPVAEAVADGRYDRGILICGTGLGMAIAANKVPGVRSVVVHDTFSAKATRQHNDSNVLAMGARVIGFGLAQDIVQTWLQTEYEGGRHDSRVGKIKAIEEKYSK